MAVFVSDKAEPDDIDTCWFLDGPALEALSEPRQQAVQILADTALSRVKWQCDRHAIVEYPPDTTPVIPPTLKLPATGTITGKDTRDQKLASRPRPAGYVEVT